MTENKLFLRWMLFVTLLIFGIGNGIPAALTLAVPEPMPKLAPATELAIFAEWTYAARYRQQEMLSELDWQAKLIQTDAEIEMFGLPPDTKCGRLQYDYDPFTGRWTIG